MRLDAHRHSQSVTGPKILAQNRRVRFEGPVVDGLGFGDLGEDQDWTSSLLASVIGWIQSG